MSDHEIDGAPADRFDQCCEYSEHAERCQYEAGHEPSAHSFEEVPDPDQQELEEVERQNRERRDAMYKHDGVHLWFNLTYANYLVVNRLLLESMTDDWQERFCKLMDEFSDELGWAQMLQNGFHVEMFAREPEIKPEKIKCESCEGTGEDRNVDVGDDRLCEECDGDGWVETEGDGYESFEEIGPGHDPVPHYRHSSKIPRASMEIAAVAQGFFSLKDEWLKENHPERAKEAGLA